MLSTGFLTTASHGLEDPTRKASDVIGGVVFTGLLSFFVILFVEYMPDTSP